MRLLSEKTKKNRHRGEGIKENYNSWIHTRELTGGKGVRSSIKDPKTGRTMHLLSQLELKAYLLLRWDDAVSDIPVFRPLIGMDKQEIIEVSKAIDTYETSILPYEDCCTIFVAKHPVTKPKLEQILKSEEKLKGIIEPLYEKAMNEIETVYLK